MQEFQDIGLEEFDQLHEALSDSRLRYLFDYCIFIHWSHHNLRYDFDADLKTLIIRMPKASHEESAMGFFRALDGSMKHQEEACGQALPWSLGTGLESRIGRSKSRFVADVTIHNDFNKPLLITEVRHTQARNNALKKIAKRMDGIPTLVGSIIINVDESPAYSPYTTPASPNDHISESQWKEIVKEAPAFGPIHYQDRCWMGSVTCSLDVRLQGEAKLRVEQAVRIDIRNKSGAFRSHPSVQGIIPQSSTVDVDIALQDIWDMVVRDVAGASTDPVPLTVDWKMFRDKLRVSLGRTAYARYEDWYDSYGVQPGREASGDLGSVRLTRAKKRERKI